MRAVNDGDSRVTQIHEAMRPLLAGAGSNCSVASIGATRINGAAAVNFTASDSSLRREIDMRASLIHLGTQR